MPSSKSDKSAKPAVADASAAVAAAKVVVKPAIKIKVSKLAAAPEVAAVVGEAIKKPVRLPKVITMPTAKTAVKTAAIPVAVAAPAGGAARMGFFESSGIDPRVILSG